MASEEGPSASGHVPTVVGYTDLRVLGRGGFATVYRARQVAFRREVALKVLDRTPASERSTLIFERECEAAGSLSWHPHVVSVHDAGTTTTDVPYLAMELLPGGTLDEALEAAPLTEAAAVRHCADVASALTASHETGLLHRDVKPANILIDRLGRARLGDFGIARLLDGGHATTTGVVAGTVAYLAPEVLDGNKATPAADVYALGMTLWTLLLGHNPYTRDTDDSPFVVLGRVMAGTLPPIPDHVSTAVADLIEAAIHRDPASRPTIEAVHAHLEIASTHGSTEDGSEREADETTQVRQPERLSRDDARSRMITRVPGHLAPGSRSPAAVSLDPAEPTVRTGGEAFSGAEPKGSTDERDRGKPRRSSSPTSSRKRRVSMLAIIATVLLALIVGLAVSIGLPGTDGPGEPEGSSDPDGATEAVATFTTT